MNYSPDYSLRRDVAALRKEVALAREEMAQFTGLILAQALGLTVPDMPSADIAQFAQKYVNKARQDAKAIVER